MKKLMSLLMLLLLNILLLNAAYAYETNLTSTADYPTINYATFRFETLKYTPYPVSPGDYFEVWIKITNIGSRDMTDVRFELLEEYPFSIYQSDSVERNFDELKKNTQVILKYKVRVDDSAIEGSENLKLRVKSDQVLSWLEYYLPIDIQTRQPTVTAKVTTEPERINPGERAKINIEIENTANSLMRDITVKLDLTGMPFTPLDSINEKKIKNLSPGVSAIVSFDIITDADAASRPYKVPLNVVFYDGKDNLQSKNYTIGVLIDSKPEIQVDLEDTKIYKEGDKGKITISVSNIGPSNLKFLSVELKNSDDYEILSNPRVYLGNLNSDDYETAEFDIYSKSSENIPLKVLITYKNAYNEDFNKIEELNLPMYSKYKATAYGLVTKSNSTFSIIAYIVIILFVYAAYKEWRVQKDIGQAIKTVIKRWIKNIINFFKWRNIRSMPRRIKNFFKE